MNQRNTSKEQVVVESIHSMFGAPFTFHQLYHRTLELNQIFNCSPWKYKYNNIVKNKLQTLCKDGIIEVFINKQKVYYRERSYRF